MLQINEVLKFDHCLYRILAILTDSIIWINLDQDNAFPLQINRIDVLHGLEDQTIERSADPYEFLSFVQPEKGSTQETKRDQNYELIQPIIQHELFYIPKERGKLIDSILLKNKVTKQTLYRLIRRYWQRGQTNNTLLPDYKNSGAKGKSRIAKDKKLGRPKVYSSEKGVNITEDIKRLFHRTITKYFLKENQHSLPFVYRKFQDLYLNLYPSVAENEIPSIWQFKYFYEKEFKKAENIKARLSTANYRKDYRPLKSTATSQALGPGSRYEIDATIADIYLVSSSNPNNIIGRPVIYFVIDVFSRLVAGFYIGLENPSYIAAIQALNMAMTDKVEYCQQFGISIKSEDWPSIGLPDAILADRGELLGYQIEALEKTFAVRIENAPPYRGDAKGIVEQAFRTKQAFFKNEAKGVVKDTIIKKRGGKDYRIEANMDMHSFTKTILETVLWHNLSHVLKKYDRDQDFPNDLPSIPIHLWNWGIQNRTGKLRAASEKALRLALLPRVEVTLSDLGLKAFGLFYQTHEINELGWLHRQGSISRPNKLIAAYDPHSVNQIYIFPDPNKLEYWIGNLSIRSREFQDCTLWEVKTSQKIQKENLVQYELEDTKNRRELEKNISERIKVKKAQMIKSSIKPTQRIAEINENKAKEKNIERKQTALQQTIEITDTNIIPMPKLKKQGENKNSELVHYPDFTNELFDEDE